MQEHPPGILMFFAFPEAVRLLCRITQSLAQLMNQNNQMHLSPHVCEILRTMLPGEASVAVGAGKLKSLFQILRKFILVLLLLQNQLWYQNVY